MKFIPRHRVLHFSGLLLSALVWLANAGNPPNGRTGAPSEGLCNSCHNGSNPNNYGGSITVSGLSSPIVPNTVYPLTVTMTTTGTGVPVRGGFQMVALDGNNVNCGDFTVITGQGTGTEFGSGREYIEHRNPKNFSGAGSSITWDLNWKSPASAAANTVKLYFIGNFCNGSGSDNDFPTNTFDTYSFLPPPAIEADITNITNVLCFGQANGNATVTAAGGNGAYTYLWSNNQTTQTVNNVAAGNYTVTVTDSGGGTATAVATITQPAAALSGSTSVSNVITCNNVSSTITANAAGGTPPYQYAWLNGNTGNTNEVTSAGTYVVTITDNNGCTKTASASVTQNLTFPIANATGSVQSCATNTATVSGQGSSSGASFTYNWTPPSGGTIISGASSTSAVVSGLGNYLLVVTNTVNGCTASAQATVTGSAPPGATATGTTLNCINSTGTISASSAAPNVTYSWQGPNNFTSTAQNPTVSQTGIYTVTITAMGCSSTATATVTGDFAPPNLSVSVTPATCVAPCTATASSTTSNVTYFWGGFGSSMPTVTLPPGGPYTVTVTATGNGCTTSSQVAYAINNTPPTVGVTGGTLSCATQQTTITATSNVVNSTYVWSGTGIVSGAQTATVTVNTGGPYTVTVTSPLNGCTSTSMYQVGVDNTPPSVSITGGTLTCAVNQVSVTATTNAGNSTFLWNGPSVISGGQTATATVGQTGTYTVTVTNQNNGCSATSNYVVTNNITPPVVSIATPPHLNCINSSVTINASGSSQGPSFNYNWNGPGVVTGQNTLTPLVNAAGVYTLTITNTLNGCTATDAVTVIQSSDVVTAIGNVIAPSCFGGANGSATAVPTGGAGGFTFLWSNGATTAQAAGLIAGTYTVTSTDSEGCTNAGSIVISQPAALTVSATSTAETGAGQNNGTATANPAGGTAPYFYLWSNNGTTQTITSLAPGAYTATVTDGNGCTAVQTVTVNSFNCVFSATLTSTNVTCTGAANGTATVVLQNATIPIVYQWSNLGFTQTISNLAPGVYTVTVTDASSCTVIVSVTIGQPAPLSANAVATPISAVGVNDGTASANPSGGVAPYFYLWNNNATTQSITGLPAGNYTVTVTDANGCTAVQSAFVSAFNCTVNAVINATGITCFGAANGAASAVLIGGTAPLTYSWNTGAITAGITALTAGVYSVTVADASGCAASSETTITEPAPLLAEVTVIHNVNCLNEKTGFVEVSVTGGGTAPFSFNYPGPGELLLGPGLYTITVTNGNGCTTALDFSIVAIDTVPPSVTCPPNIVKCDDGTLTNYNPPTATDNCFVGSLQFALIQGEPSGSPLSAGVYNQVFRVTDLAGNSSTCSFSITIFTPPDIALVSITYDTNGLGTGTINIVPLGGTLPYTYEWTKDGAFFSDDEDLTGLFAGTYKLKATDANGCEVTVAPFNILLITGTVIPFSQAGISVSPNPADALISIDFKQVNPVALEIYDAYGRLVLQLYDRHTFNYIDLTTIPAGVYHILVDDDQGQRYIARFVKAN